MKNRGSTLGKRRNLMGRWRTTNGEEKDSEVERERNREDTRESDYNDSPRLQHQRSRKEKVMVSSIRIKEEKGKDNYSGDSGKLWQHSGAADCLSVMIHIYVS
jgi:hypothetical protein